MHLDSRWKTPLIFLAGILFGLTIFKGLLIKWPTKKGNETTMSVEGRLLWTSLPQRSEQAGNVYFFFDSAVGLTDIDFHQISGEGWSHMKSPGGEAGASLFVSTGASIGQIEKAIQEIASKGGYKAVEIKIRP